ncbi:hypothetical protein PXH66_10785 [Synoicihabitans lomoniglobus]|uniref:Nucleotide-diphospho-sugar transferase domain-containing protein n=1 Tax=Synoicihabitans lomoniglobus TaxID=2909285 RepID=A0AAF0I5K6_9BACT|nr:hypothetical protein PXH66_10785 [Opitutaceae bacterium LMO-M01]
MRALPSDEFLIYADAGTAFVASPESLFPLCRERNGLLMFQVHGYKNVTYVKRDCFVLMDCDMPHYWQAEQVNAAFLVLQRTPTALAFIAEWIAWADSHELITDAPNRFGEPNLPDFLAHRHDQSILSLLAEKHRIPRSPDPSQWGEPHRHQSDGKFVPYPTIFRHHRQRTLFLRERLRIWLGARRHALFGEKKKTSVS